MESSTKGLEGTGMNLLVNRRSNLKSASSDQNLLEILSNMKASKTTAVINYDASWYVSFSCFDARLGMCTQGVGCIAC
ncbi:hypothetical protein JCGZ_20018 [Jatropha curcas]|uniref:Uncharacterized protein n=1 Tax=Jatropha curcas TaxID=180498 RepID=A0A067JXE5_JATCU|nr:thioredoxin-like 3-3 [Jatropha curcas]KDP27483.1 hypothetical protein JCGZ_20018 [Jatropha curcas]